MSMLKDPSSKYRAFPTIDIPDRTWPSKTITQAPIWCSSDLRDGNQSLIEPMDAVKKLRFWKTLVAVGVKEIEASFPAASQTDFDFVRTLIEDNHIPEDTTIQVLTQGREDLIARTFESLRGAKKAIVHLYNATSPSFRRIVFNQDKDGIKAIAVNAAKLFVKYAAQQPETQWTFEYSPETFSATELEFAKEVCDAVIEVWNPTPEHKMILNLPATVECATPNIYADQIEWFGRHINRRDSVIISLHTHNDRGTGVAATELGLMAGADRVEGCLFGNGERTGNVDLVTVALNMYTQGLDPQLDFSDIDGVRKVVEECNQIQVHPRHPYVGDLVHTAFSGSHQDAIRKGFSQQKDDALWEVPYLPIDPADIGRSYEAVIRVNSQSGKGGIAYLLEQEYDISLPRRMQIEFSQVVQAVMDAQGREVTASDIWRIFESEYRLAEGAVTISDLTQTDVGEGRVSVAVEAAVTGRRMAFEGAGNGPVDAFVDGLSRAAGVPVKVLNYHEHSMGGGAQARAAAYVEVRVGEAAPVFGVGIDANIVRATLLAVLSATSRGAGPVVVEEGAAQAVA